MFHLIRNGQTLSPHPQCLYHLALLPSVYESISCSLSCQFLVWSFIFYFSHSTGYGVVSHYELNFISIMTNNIEYIFHMPISHSYTHIFFSEVSIQIFFSGPKPCNPGSVAWCDTGLICLLGGVLCIIPRWDIKSDMEQR